MMPPVLVPVIRSKCSTRRLPVISSRLASTEAVYVPLMPPPSSASTRKGVGRGTPFSLVPSIRLLLVVPADCLVVDRLDPAAEPDPQRPPRLVEKQPLRDPRHNGVRQRHVRVPLTRPGQ